MLPSCTVLIIKNSGNFICR